MYTIFFHKPISTFLILSFLASFAFATIPSTTQSWRFVDLNNQYRSQTVPVAANMRALTFDTSLSTTANNWATQCIWGASGTSNVGETLYATSQRTSNVPDFNVDAVVDSFVTQWKDYSQVSNTCGASSCTNYTQMIWDSTVNVGCAIQDCSSITNMYVNGGTLVVCHYTPRGNFPGLRPFTAANMINSWSQIGSNFNWISAKGTRVWAIDVNGNPYSYNGNNWQQRLGSTSFANLGASPDNWSWGVTTGGVLQRWSPNLNTWQTITLPNGVTSVVQADSISQALSVILDQNGQVWNYNQGVWTSLGTQTNNRWVSIGYSNDILVLNSSGELLRWSRSVNDWVPLYGTGQNVLHVTDLQNILTIDANNFLYQYKNSFLVRLNTPVLVKSAAMSGGKVYIVGTTGEVYVGV
jgi:pathogenesis-related protein 1